MPQQQLSLQQLLARFLRKLNTEAVLQREDRSLLFHAKSQPMPSCRALSGDDDFHGVCPGRQQELLSNPGNFSIKRERETAGPQLTKI
jgi:hypothetical protein